MNLTDPAGAAYIHVPFCRHRCGYCNFTLVAGRDDLIDDYLAAVQREMSWLGSPQPVSTLFIGGGTPTHLPPEKLRHLLSLARQWFPLEEGYELSVEANPEDIDQASVSVLAESGVNRLSLGVQSFDSSKLEKLQRQHRPETTGRAFHLARQQIKSVSIDLIFAAPGETLDVWQNDLAAAIDLQPDHISTYGLTYERGAPFWSRFRKGQITSLEEGLELAMYQSAIDRLCGAGYEHYEVSNFARPGHRCRHNLNYWSAGEYFAIGPGASRHIGGRRETNHRSTFTYIKRVLAGHSPVAESETLPAEDAARERLVFALRMIEGVDRQQFARETGFTIESLLGEVLQPLLRQKLLEQTESRLRLTREGLMVSDSIWPEFLRV